MQFAHPVTSRVCTSPAKCQRNFIPTLRVKVTASGEYDEPFNGAAHVAARQPQGSQMSCAGEIVVPPWTRGELRGVFAYLLPTPSLRATPPKEGIFWESTKGSFAGLGRHFRREASNPVIPAQAGIQYWSSCTPPLAALGSRCRGNDLRRLRDGPTLS